MTIKQAREKYKAGKITFKELDKIWWDKATKEEAAEFWAAPVYDRPYVIEGLSQEERDRKYNTLFKAFRKALL